MAYSLKKVLTSMAASFVAVTGLVSADGSTTYSYNPNSCNTPCKPCGTDCCGDWFVDVDVLYWKACEGGLTYGSETDFHELIASSTYSDYDIKKKSPHHRWDVGVRVGVGYHFACECYDAAFYWTHFDTDAQGHYDEPANESHWFTPAWAGVAPALGGNTSGEHPVDRASAHWKLRVNLFDLEIGRSFCVNSCLSLRPYIGVRGAVIDQRYDLEYHEAEEFCQTHISSPVRDSFSLKSDFKGAGIRIGSDIDYNLGCGISLFGDLAASLLWGETEVKTQEAYDHNTCEPTFNGVTSMDQRDSECGARAITDAQLGVRWQQCCCSKVITLEFGWEHHFFFNKNNFEKFTNYAADDEYWTDRFPQTIHGDLSLQGFFFSAKVEF